MKKLFQKYYVLLMSVVMFFCLSGSAFAGTAKLSPSTMKKIGKAIIEFLLIIWDLLS